MNRIILFFSGAVAATLLLVGTFVTAAGMLGANLHELPVVGGLFPAPAVASMDPELNDMNTSVEEQVDSDLRSPDQVVDNSSSPLHAFLLPSPWSSKELEDLEGQLKMRMNALTEGEKNLEARKASLEESQRHLNELQAELESIRNGLINERDETVALEEETKVKEAAANAKRVADLKEMASLFGDGSAEEMAKMLIDVYPPADIGLVLSGLEPDRVRVLLQGISTQQPEVLADVEASYRAALTQ